MEVRLITGKEASKRYRQKAILRVNVDFNRNTEPELVEKIQSVENRSRYIKDLVKRDIEAEKLRDES